MAANMANPGLMWRIMMMKGRELQKKAEDTSH
jgi:hypothetical protein